MKPKRVPDNNQIKVVLVRCIFESQFCIFLLKGKARLAPSFRMHEIIIFRDRVNDVCRQNVLECMLTD